MLRESAKHGLTGLSTSSSTQMPLLHGVFIIVAVFPALRTETSEGVALTALLVSLCACSVLGNSFMVEVTMTETARTIKGDRGSCSRSITLWLLRPRQCLLTPRDTL